MKEIFNTSWWFPFWVCTDWWHNEVMAVEHAKMVKHPNVVEIV